MVTYQRLMRIPPLDFIRRPVTLVLVCVGWVFFRADSIRNAVKMLVSMGAFWRPLTAGNSVHLSSTPALLMALVAMVVLAGWIGSVVHTAAPRRWSAAQVWLSARWASGAGTLVLRPAIYALSIALLVLWPPHVTTQFIYFRF